MGDHALSGVSFTAIEGILLGTSAILLGVVAMIYQLAGFHCMLLYYGMTTYDFIVEQQRKERDKAAKKIMARQTSPGGAPQSTALGREIKTYEQFKEASKKLSSPSPPGVVDAAARDVEAGAGQPPVKSESRSGESEVEIEQYDVTVAKTSSTL